MKKIIVIVNIGLLSVMSSLVRDIYYDKNKITEQYCPKSEYCEEGTHVMCMYYNPTERMGKLCHDAQDILITPAEAEKLLDISNMIRGNIARGKEVGKNGVPLPRAFGMYRLEWDEELASFAQVLANSCILRHDLCRATKKFPDPGQTTGVVRFSYPEWYSIFGPDVFPPGLSEEKLLYSIKHITRSWYNQKVHVSPDMVTQYPDWADNIDKVAGKLYLEMIAGEATHMGCGISAYAEYAYHANNADLSYYNVHVVCNYSVKPRKGEPLYNTKPPTQSDVGFTVRCGCPVGYDEDYNCLCYQSSRTIPNTCLGDMCKPSVVLLPIFTVEDAPVNKMVHSQGPVNDTLRFNDSFELLDYYGKKNSRKSLNGIETEPSIITSRTLGKKPTDVSRRYFGQSKMKTFTRPSPVIVTPKKIKKFNNQSIFTRNAAFVLPTKKVNITPIVIKKDVVPRKDFANVRTLVTTYLTRRRNGNQTDYFNTTHDITTEKSTTIDIFSFNKYLKDHNASKFKNDEDKLIKLLEDLQSVDHTGVDRKDEDIFEAKLRQLYKSLGRNINRRNDTAFNNPFEGYLLQNTDSIYRLDTDGRVNRNSLFNYPMKQKDQNKALERKFRHMYGVRRKNKDLYRRHGDLRRNFYLREDNEDELLSIDRRRFYQEKLDNLERRLQSMRNNYRRKDTIKDDRPRPVRPPTAMDSTFYMPDRARFSHGF